MRLSLWPEHTADDHLAEMKEILNDPNSPVFLAIIREDGVVGFLEAGLRKYADGCDTSPVGYIEGWYVAPGYRRLGVGKLLVDATEAWARQQGCQEMASDSHFDNTVSYAAHLALGYKEVERLVHYKKRL